MDQKWKPRRLWLTSLLCVCTSQLIGGFTPILKDFYEEVEAQGVEIIFVSSDRDPEAMMSYMKESHGDWYALEHGNLKRELSEKYNVRGIPTLVVLKGDGTLISANGRGDVH